MKRVKYTNALILLSILCLASLLAITFYHYDIFRFKWAAREVSLRYKTFLVKQFPFSEENSLKEWEEKIFKGKVVYAIEDSISLSYVKATSRQAASALYYKVKLDAKRRRPVISWKWNVREFPKKNLPESLETKDENDFAARVYAIFPAAFFTHSKVIEYVWTETLPEGTIGTSPYFKNIKIIVVRSGPNKENRWFLEERDVVEDYKKAFGRKPEYDIGAVAFMTNAEHTKTSAESLYDDIKLGYKED